MANEKNHNSEFYYSSLEAIRTRLLDLTMRNTLLSFRHSKAKSIQIVNEVPNQIADFLKSGKSFIFSSIPDPTEQQLIASGLIEANDSSDVLPSYPSADVWAKKLGLPTSYDLPAQPTEGHKNHQDQYLQTLLYSGQLESRLRLIKSQAELSIEETGNNILYLVLGFLEWDESLHSTKKRLAPLFALPVKLERGALSKHRGAFDYSISLLDDSVLTNITLKEKLKNDYGLILPELLDEHTPEEYFNLIQNIILKEQPRWGLKRQASLVLLNFSKQAMYEDLNPENWPAGYELEEHPVIRRLFGGSGEELTNEYHEEYDIDDIDHINSLFPIVYDADSSQHSALIDAVKGENLVIEGPPGSGKSQTITNLIAACINSGKKVLFVAEKMAALNVVKNRLDNAGLGDFCLELHSHKTNKLNILNSLLKQMEVRDSYKTPQDLDIDIQRHEVYKNKLNEYVDEINSKWKNTGLTVHEILNKSVRLRNDTKINPEDFRIEILDDIDVTPMVIKEVIDNSLLLEHIFLQVQEQSPTGLLADHYWVGINKEKFLDFEQQELFQSLEGWSVGLSDLESSYIELCNQLEFLIDDGKVFISDILDRKVVLCKLPEAKGHESFASIPLFALNLDNIKNIFDVYKKYHEQLLLVSNVFSKNCFSQIENSDVLKDSVNQLSFLTNDQNMTIVRYSEGYQIVQDLLVNLDKVQKRFDLIKNNVSFNLKDIFEASDRNFTELNTLVNLINLLPIDLWQYRNQVFDSHDMDMVLSQLVEILEEVVPLHHELAKLFYIDDLPEADELEKYFNVLSAGGVFKIFSSEWRNSKNSILALTKQNKTKIKDIQKFLPNLIKYKKQLDMASDVNDKNSSIQHYYKGVDTPIDKMVTLRSWYKAIREEYGFGFGERVKLGTCLFTLDRDLAHAISSDYDNELKGIIDKCISLTKQLQQRFDGFLQSSDHNELYLSDTSGVKRLFEILKRNLGYAAPKLLNESIEIKVLIEKTEQLQEAAYLKEKLQNNIHQVPDLYEAWQLSALPGEFDEYLYQKGVDTLFLVEELVKDSNVYQSICNEPTGKRYEQLRLFGSRLEEVISKEQQCRELFTKKGHVILDEWMTQCSDEVSLMIKRNKHALNKPGWLATWAEYIQVRNRLSQNGLMNIIEKLERQDLLPGTLNNIIQLSIYHHLSKQILQENNVIHKFNGMEQKGIIDLFREYDKKIMALQRDQIAFNASRAKVDPGISSGRVGDFTESALIKHEGAKKTRHIAIRSLLDRASTSIQALKPCFMMSPMSVAQYLKPGHFNFDLVVMDEASQILPEDALGAIARGSSVVIVGDPKQLPPTNFFKNSNITEDEPEELTTLEETESILESVMSIFKTRRLRWHYRSRHESLIAFSNKHFYDSDLVLFPSPRQASEEFGIQYIKVANGCFNEGKNCEEAEAIIQEAVSILLNGQNESVGIVAMNSQQRDEIAMRLEFAIKDNPVLQRIVENNQEDPIFVKNLENVQGDERDVILISMTYGPYSVGERVFQRFGPINRADGWKRLNVLFTRAKKRMHILSSMSSIDILVSESSQKGVKALKSFLEYCELGHLQNSTISGKAPDSDFEISVISALNNHGYNCEPQLGVAGFFLDIAVKNPSKPGHFMLAIECDGATYHSAKSARDRDRLRQEILENLGWEIHRIWSTDWFQNPEAQLQPILNRLEKLRGTE